MKLQEQIEETINTWKEIFTEMMKIYRSILLIEYILISVQETY